MLPTIWRRRGSARSPLVEVLLPLLVEQGVQRRAQLRQAFQPGVGRDDADGLLAGGCDDLLVVDDGEHPQGGADTGLGLAEDVALAPLFEVDAGELEAVEGGGDRGEPGPGGARLGPR